MNSIYLYNSAFDDLSALMADWGEPAFRAKQLYRHLYVQHSERFDEMTDLPKALRDRLEQKTTLFQNRLVRVLEGDGGMTRKALFEVAYGITIESVLMIYEDRATVCVSSQAGCPMGCTFCATAKLGFLLDLSPGQIIEQVIWAANELRRMGVDQELSNVVFMGMGEPFNNYDNWWEAVERLHDPQGFNMGARRFTVSTVGLVPGIRKLAEEALPVNLAISLHSPDDAVRSAMMPVNKRYPIGELLEATSDYLEKTGRRVSFEYVLLQDENDTPELAALLAQRLKTGPLAEKRTLFHVNLIPWNPVPGSPLARSQRQRVLAFQAILKEQGVPCTVRVERGVDIGAACGQLAGNADA